MTQKGSDHIIIVNDTPDIADNIAKRVHSAGSNAVMHDVNNMLGAILGMADMIEEEIPEGHICHSRATKIVRAVQRCVDLLRTTLPAKSSTPEKHDEIDIASLIEEVVSLVTHSRKLNTKIEICHKTENVTIYGNTTEIASALMNLFLNALEAMPEGGHLQISTLLVRNENDTSLLKAGMLKAEEYIQIEISDTGVGIPSDKLQYIFDPFFSTKSSSKKAQRGIGLYRVRECIISHGGIIQVSSIPANGTTFTIMLPVAEAQKQTNTPATSQENEFPKIQKVIVIDDDETIRDVITSMLTNARIEVVAYSNPIAAISWLSENIGYANIAIVEYRLPVLDGLNCIKTIQAIDPNLSCILCSGITNGSLFVDNSVTFLSKPFLKAELFNAIDTSLSAKRRTVCPQ